MDAEPLPRIAELSSHSSINPRIASHKRHKTPHGCCGGSGHIQLLSNRGTPYSAWIRLLSIAFSSLAVVYFLVRCFKLVRGIPRVVGSRRSLAAGSYGACQEYTSPSGEEAQEWLVGGLEGAGEHGEIGVVASEGARWEPRYMLQQEWRDGGLGVAGDHDPAGIVASEEEGLEQRYRPQQEWWAGGLGGGGEHGQSRVVASQDGELEPGYVPQWLPGPVSTSSGEEEGFFPFSLPSEQGSAAPGVVFVEQGVQRGDLPIRVRGPVQYPSGPRVRWSAEGGRIEEYFAEAKAEGRGDDKFRMEWVLQLSTQEDLSLWEGRNLPPYAIEQVGDIFERMIVTTAGCQTLLEALPGNQGLRLAHSVMRLLALDLGALSVIPRHLERFRSVLGDQLVELGSCALQHTAEERELRSMRLEIGSLMDLISKLKRPHASNAKLSTVVRKKKMVSLIGTAGMTVNACSVAISRLSSLRGGTSGHVPEHVMEQQLRVLKALFDVHSRYIAMDTFHRYYLLGCQKRVGKQLLLGPEHRALTEWLLPSLKHLLWEIGDAVRRAGGVLFFPEMHRLPQRTFAGTALDAQRTGHLHRQPFGSNAQTQMDEGLPQESHSSSEYAGLTPSLEVHAAAPSIGPAPPQVAAWRLGTQPVESVKPTFPHHPQYAWNTKQEELENPPYLLASRILGTSMSWMHTPAHGDTGTHPPVSRKTQQPRGTMTSLPTSFHGDDVGVTSLQRSLLEHSLYAVSRRPEQQSPGASAEASVGVESRRGFFRGGNVPDQALPAPWAPASTDSGQHMPTRVVTWTYGAGEQSIPQRPRPEQADGMLAELIKGGLRLEDIFPEESDVSSPL